MSVTRMPHRKPPETLRETSRRSVRVVQPVHVRDRRVDRLAQAQASAIDNAEDRNYAVAKVGPQLLATLVELGGTPGSRKALGVEAKVKGKLAQLREGRGRAS